MKQQISHRWIFEGGDLEGLASSKSNQATLLQQTVEASKNNMCLHITWIRQTC